MPGNVAAQPERIITSLLLRVRGHHTIRQKSYANEPFGSPLPFGTVLKEGFERKKSQDFPLNRNLFINERL